jgi:hypothetical protein
MRAIAITWVTFYFFPCPSRFKFEATSWLPAGCPLVSFKTSNPLQPAMSFDLALVGLSSHHWTWVVLGLLISTKLFSGYQKSVRNLHVVIAVHTRLTKARPKYLVLVTGLSRSLAPGREPIHLLEMARA